MFFKVTKVPRYSEDLGINMVEVKKKKHTFHKIKQDMECGQINEIILERTLSFYTEV